MYVACVTQYMHKVDGIIEQSTQMGFEGEDLSQAAVVVPKVDFNTVAKI